jgi:DNA invertase Pin-like site-specific DNA recombinase
MTRTKVRRAVGYVRLSKETEDTTSPQRQRRAIKRLCDERGWQLVHVYEDLDQSAYNGNHRPDFDAMMARLADVDAIVFWKLDRLSRSSVQAGEIAKACKDADVDLVATDMDLDTSTSGGKFIYTIMAAAGEMESDRISERSRGAMAYKREHDEWVGRPPYGWRVKDKHLVRDPAQQKVIRSAARDFLAGATYTEIAETYGFKAPQIIRSILRSPRVRDELGDLGLDLAAAIKTRTMRRAPSSSPSLLGGIARCGMCGAGLRRSSTRAGRNGTWWAYRCKTAGHVGIAAPFLEEHVRAAVLDAIDLKELTRRMRDRLRRPPKAAEVVAIEARLQNLEDSFGDGTLSKVAFIRQRDRQFQKLEAARQATVEEQIPELPLELARHLDARWPTMTTAGRRDVIQALVREVVVSKADGNGPIDPARVRIEWRI